MAASPMPLTSASRAGGAATTSAKEPNLRDQFLGERFDVALRNGAEQHQLEQFVVAHRLAPAVAEAAAQPFAVAVIMRRRLGKAGLTPIAASLCRHETAPTPLP